MIGDELLDGRVTDTNSVYFARGLQEVGLPLMQRTTVRDDLDDITREARATIARGTELCLVSGGLGPTTDDITAEAMAQLAAVDLVRDAAQVARIEERLMRLGRTVTDNQRRQADRPRGATLMRNARGTAPGFELHHQGCRFVCMPGVPAELEAMFAEAVLAPLRHDGAALDRRVLCTFGLIEAEVDSRLSDLAARWPAVRVGYRVRFPEVHVSLSAVETVRGALDEAEAFVRAQLGGHIYGTASTTLAEALLERLGARGETLALAESASGGLIADLLTDVPGASAILRGGIVAYNAETKESLLQVEARTLEHSGVVSTDTALAMAHGARERLRATYGLAVTGIAGPSGGNAETPVGTVCIAAVGPTFDEVRRQQFSFDRRRNKVLFAYHALDLLRREVDAIRGGTA